MGRFISPNELQAEAQKAMLDGPEARQEIRAQTNLRGLRPSPF